jgi:hypothetical protein
MKLTDKRTHQLERLHPMLEESHAAGSEKHFAVRLNTLRIGGVDFAPL